MYTFFFSLTFVVFIVGAVYLFAPYVFSQIVAGLSNHSAPVVSSVGRQQVLEYLDFFNGLRGDPASGGQVYTIVCPQSELLARTLIEALPANRELTFYDKFYPSPSDPGAYVMVRALSGQYIYRLGNHGWTNDWRRGSRKALAKYLERRLSTSGSLSLDPCDPEEARKVLFGDG